MEPLYRGHHRDLYTVKPLWGMMCGESGECMGECEMCEERCVGSVGVRWECEGCTGLMVYNEPQGGDRNYRGRGCGDPSGQTSLRQCE